MTNCFKPDTRVRIEIFTSFLSTVPVNVTFANNGLSSSRMPYIVVTPVCNIGGRLLGTTSIEQWLFFQMTASLLEEIIYVINI